MAHRADREEVARDAPLRVARRGRHRPRARSCRSSRRRTTSERVEVDRAPPRPRPLASAARRPGRRPAHARRTCPPGRAAHARRPWSLHPCRTRATQPAGSSVSAVERRRDSRPERIERSACITRPCVDVLRLVVDAGLAAPADEEQDGDPIDRRVDEREQRVDDVSGARVLQVDDGQLARSRGGSRRRARPRPLVRADDVSLGRHARRRRSAQRSLSSESGTPREEREAVRASASWKSPGPDHAPPGISRSTSPMGRRSAVALVRPAVLEDRLGGARPWPDRRCAAAGWRR